MGEIMIRNKSFIHSIHNDIQCIESLDPNDKGTSRQYWFSANMLANIFDISSDTVRNHVNFLTKWGEVTMAKNFVIVQIQNSAGAVKDTTLYDLQVFNKLAMQLRTDAAMEIRSKFSDILVEIETTGSYNIQKSTPSYEIEDPIKRAKAWIAEQEAKIALEAKNNELTEQLAITSDERDEAIKSRGRINNRITASSMQLAGQCVKEVKYLESECVLKDEEINKQASQIIDTLDKLDIVNHQKALVESKLDAILSSMYSVDDVYHHVENLFHTGYQPSTLRSKLRKELNRISYTFGEVPKTGVNKGNPEHNPPKYYTKRVVEQIIENGKNDPMYFKRLKG